LWALRDLNPGPMDYESTCFTSENELVYAICTLKDAAIIQNPDLVCVFMLVIFKIGVFILQGQLNIFK